MMTRTSVLAAFVGLSTLALGASGCTAADDSTDGSDDALVGGTWDLRWAASGYLVHGATLDDAARAKVACGATLVAPNVIVTAAHCVLNAGDDVWAFGTGHLASSKPIEVVAKRIHPSFHPAPETKLDITYYLRNFDVATLVLKEPVANVAPAMLPNTEAPRGCSYLSIGYRDRTRKSAGACVEFHVTLNGDPIFEVHPTNGAALCHSDGDEGSALITGAGDAPILRGIYVGSVTQGFTDCKSGSQYMNGHESMYGFRDFVEESIRQAESAR